MRILFASTRGAGHIGPLVPFAHACVAARHEVRVATAPSAAHHVRRAGLPYVPLDEPDEEVMAPAWAKVRATPRDEQGPIVIREVFAGEFARSALPKLLEFSRNWRPDVIVRETTEYASPLAADAIGVPVAHVGCFLMGPIPVEVSVEEPLGRLRAQYGLPPRGASDEPFLTLAPRSLEDPRQAALPATHRFRGPRVPARALPDWWNGSTDPLVYVSFGSAAAGNGFFPGTYREAADALRDLPIRVLMTLGTEVEPEDLGPVPANVHVEPWVPQGAVMAHAAAMVGHGGSGSTLAALTAGIPLAVLPLFADQPENAQRVSDLGAGLQVGNTAALADAVGELLEDPFYRLNARSVAAEIATLAPVDEAVGVLEDLAGARELRAA